MKSQGEQKASYTTRKAAGSSWGDRPRESPRQLCELRSITRLWAGSVNPTSTRHPGSRTQQSPHFGMRVLVDVVTAVNSFTLISRTEYYREHLSRTGPP